MQEFLFLVTPIRARKFQKMLLAILFSAHPHRKNKNIDHRLEEVFHHRKMQRNRQASKG